MKATLHFGCTNSFDRQPGMLAAIAKASAADAVPRFATNTTRVGGRGAAPAGARG